MNPISSSTTVAPAPSAASAQPAQRTAAAAPKASTAAREVTQITAVVGGVILVGALLQLFIAPGPMALVAAGCIASVAIFALSLVAPGRLRQTLSGFRFVSVLLVALALAAVLGTLVLQNKPIESYPMKYGALGDLIVALRLDDIFHSLWFAGLLALFASSVVNSAIMRWPVRLKTIGFFTCHLGLITSLAGAAVSTTMSVRGRVDLHAGGESARGVVVQRAGMPTGEIAPLGFDLRLDRFDLVRYTSEFRVGYYQPKGNGWMLKASFDPELGRHMLPGGDSFRVKAVYPDYVPGAAAPAAGSAPKELKNPAVVLEITERGQPREVLLVAAQRNGIQVGQGALTFERREDEVKAYRSHVTASAGARSQQAQIEVNSPFTFDGWTLYQVNYDPRDPTYSGLDAVRDPGVAWVFLGFALISLGVFLMFYVEPRLRTRGARA